MTATGRQRTAAIVLAGGRSARFGRDKRRELVDGRTLLDRVLNAVASVSDVTVLVLAPGETTPSVLPDVRVAHDQLGFAGPLAGLAVGLGAADDADAVLVVGADMPSLQPAVLRLLLDRALEPSGPDAWTLEGPDPNIVGPLPLAGRSSALRTVATRLLEVGERSLRSLVRELDAGRIPATDWRPLDPEALTLRDVDRPEDLRKC